MKIITYLITVCFLFFSSNLWCQPNNTIVGDVVMPAPNAGSLGKYGDIPISLHTGTASTSIPIHTVIDGSVSLPISLDYHGSGIRVAETASWVGIGWSLQAGGIITRTTQGIDDDVFGDGFYHDSASELETDVLPYIMGQKDAEPDIYSFNVGGYSGKFFFDVNQKVHFLPKQDLKIETNLDGGGSGVFEQFTLIAPDGTKYHFGQDPLELTRKAMEFSRSSGENPKTTASSWYLVRIQSHDDKHTIKLIYDNEKYSYINIANREYQEAFFTNGDCFGLNNGVKNTALPGYDVNHHYVSTSITGKRLSQIITSSVEVNFNVDPTVVREDLDSHMDGANTSKKLEEIEIISGSYCSKFELAHSYYEDKVTSVGTTLNEPFKKRLKLLNVQQTDCNNTTANTIPPYVFEYYDTIRAGVEYLPHRLNKGIDHWGFYNGADGTNTMVANNENIITNIPPTNVTHQNVTFSYGSSFREPDYEYAKFGTLKKITYPTGGHSEFDFESNKYLGEIPNGSPVTVLELENTSCINNNGNYDIENCCGSYTLNDTYTFTSINQIDDMHFRLYLGEGCMQPPSSPVYKASIEVYRVSDNFLIGDLQINQGNDGYLQDQWHLLSELEIFGSFAANQAYRFELCVTNGVSIFTLQERPTILGSKAAGGLRIKQVLSHDGISAANDIIKTYEYLNDNNEESGQLYYEPRYGLELDFITACYGTSSGSAGQSDPVPVHVGGALFFDQSFVSLADFDGRFIGYTHVKESLNGNGYKKHKYSHNIDYMIFYQPTYPVAPKKYNGYNGKEEYQQSYNSNDNLISETNTDANGNPLITIFPTTFYKFSRPVSVDNSFGGGSNPFPNNPNNLGVSTSVIYTSYQMETSVYRIDHVEEIIDGVSNTTSYDYDYNYLDGDLSNDYYFPTSVSSTNSDGKIYTNYNEYAFNFTDAVSQEMVNRNIIASPIRTTKEVDGQLVDGRYQIYAFFNSSGLPVGSNTDPIYVKEVQRHEATFDGVGTLIPGIWDVQGTILEYDMTVGKPKRFQQNGWEEETYIWDAANKLIHTREYEGFTWTYNYHPNTRLLSEIIDIDGQDIDFTYDQLMRLKTTNARDGNVITTYDYYFTNGTDKNYVKTRTDFNSVVNSQLSWRENWEYIDGLGRHLQNVQRHHGPNQEDIISDAVAYDNQGRVVKSYEPFIGGNNTGEFIDPTGQDFTLSEFYADPLNRIHKVTPPNWYAITYEYSNNNSALVSFDVGFNYPANSLYVNTLVDPDGNKTITYTDKRGRSIMDRRSNSSGADFTDTKRAYDFKDRKSAVYPPGTSSFTSGLFFKYLYDGEDNLIEKTLPDVSTPYKYEYDERNLLVATRNPILQSDNKWLITQYDDYGRATKTGFYNGASIPDVNNTTINTLLTETFYDGFNGSSTINLISNPQYIGRIRKTRTKLLDDNTVNNNWQEEIFLYDTYGRVNNSAFIDHIGGTRTNTFSYDWIDNNTTHSLSYSNSFISSLNNQKFMLFDHSGRMTDYYNGLSGSSLEHVCHQEYTPKDLLKEKNLGIGTSGTLQSIDYMYNAQRWLTHINNPDNLGLTGSLPMCNGGINSFNESATSSSVNGGLDPDGNDLFHLELRYDNPNIGHSLPSQKDGNISEVVWQTINKPAQSYGIEYDYLDRLTSTNHASYPNGLTNPLQYDNYYNTAYEYQDGRGNFAHIFRKGMKMKEDCYDIGTIDSLVYEYYPNSNQIKKITDGNGVDCPIDLLVEVDLDEQGVLDAENQVTGINTVCPYGNITYQANNCVLLEADFEASPQNGGTFIAQIAPCDNYASPVDLLSEGFNQTSEDDYEYDPAGNMTRDPNKEITISYNYLNLPYKILWDNGNEIQWEYDAIGTKLTKKIYQNGNLIDKRDYTRGMEFRSDTLEAVYHDEGRVINKGDNTAFDWEYQYMLKDHLGNTRVLFSDQDGNQEISFSEILSEDHYYPFGMAQNGPYVNNIDNTTSNPSNRYLYNGKELNNDFGLNWYSYGARWYDAAVGRFHSVDPIIDQFPYVTTYNYAENEPIRNIDLHGLQQYDMASHDPGMNAANATPDERRNYQQQMGNGFAGGVIITGAALVVTEMGVAGVANEVKDEALSQATGGASDVLDVSKQIKNLGEKAVKKVFTATDGPVDLNRAPSPDSSGGIGGTFVTEKDITNPDALREHMDIIPPNPFGRNGYPSTISEIEVPSSGLKPDPTDTRVGKEVGWIAPNTKGAKVTKTYNVSDGKGGKPIIKEN